MNGMDVTHHIAKSSHIWGEKDCDWEGLNDAANLLFVYCRRYGGFFVYTKEKWGCVRGYTYMTRIRNPILCKLFQRLLYWYQRKVYRWAYKRLIKKFPHLVLEILVDADYPELLQGLGVNFDDHWNTYSSKDVDT